MNIELLTENAEACETMSEEGYRDIYDELRNTHLPMKERPSLDKFCSLIESKIPKMTWSRWEKGEGKLTRVMRNELRVAMRLDVLPPTVLEVMDDIDPDVKIVKVGNNETSYVILVGTSEVMTVDLTEHGLEIANVAKQSVLVDLFKKKRVRKPLIRPIASERQRDLKQLTGCSWSEIIDAGLLQMLKNLSVE
jgi:hypothetical protein